MRRTRRVSCLAISSRPTCSSLAAATPRFLDFGLAKRAPQMPMSAGASLVRPTMVGEEHLTSPGTTVGTVAYLHVRAPGAAAALGTPCHRSRRLAGTSTAAATCSRSARCSSKWRRVPSRSRELTELTGRRVRCHPSHGAAPARAIQSAVPAETGRDRRKALEEDRELRYQSAADLRSDRRRLTRDLDMGFAFVSSVSLC